MPVASWATAAHTRADNILMLSDVACRECGADVLSAAGLRAGGRWVIRFACRSCSASGEVESDERITVSPATEEQVSVDPPASRI